MNRRRLLQGASMAILSGKLLPGSRLYGQSSANNSASVPDRSGSSTPRTFILANCSRDIDEFRTFAQAASKLKPYGDVQVNIGILADKSWYEMPTVNSPWHEYANEMSCMAKFFPHPKVAPPYIPADWVAKNRDLLLAKADVLRQLGLHAAFSSDDTHFFSEAFFDEYPNLRGPRIDHPRRSNRAEFAWCVDLQETRDMIEWMATELKRQVPEIRTILSHNNDAGGGFCWAAALYSGPNGPHHCEGRNAGVRVRDYTEAIHRGAQKGGGDVVIRMNGNFWQGEDDLVVEMMPPNTCLEEGHDPATISVGSLIYQAYPLRGILDPITTLTTLEKLTSPEIKTVRFNTSPPYSRMDESLPTVEMLIEMQQECILEPTHGLISRFDKLHKLALRWGGQQNADALVEAFYEMNEAFLLKDAVAPRYSNIYCAVSTRYVTRPLLFKPDVLSGKEESYFLPYVFNVSESEARNDYADIHGGRMTGPASWEDSGLQLALSRALHAAKILEGMKDAPAQKWLRQYALSLRMWASEVRSINNFYFAQLLRDRNAAIVAAGPRTASKQANWTGDGDYLAWNQIQRDEFDNTNELIALLQSGGLDLMGHAKDKRYEDTFLFGPDIIGALHEKTRLMQREWLDVQMYLASPLK